MKRLNKKNLIIILIIAFLSIFFIGAGAVILNLNVKEEFEIHSGFDTFLIENGSYHYEDNSFSGNKSLNITRKHPIGFEETQNCDLLIYTTDKNTTIDSDYNEKQIYEVTNGYVVVFSKILVSDKTEAENGYDLYTKQINVTSDTQSIKVVCVRYSELNNAYISSKYELDKINNEKKHNNIEVLKGNSKIYKNIYVIDDFNISKEMNLTIPCYINLLYNNITLNDNLILKHSFGGMYVIDSITGKINNEENKLILNTPNAYYSFIGSISNNDNYEIKSSYDKFSGKDDTAKACLDLLLNDACDYALNIIPDNVFNDLNLPNYFDKFNVGFTYEFLNNKISADGVVTRGEESFNESVNITATYIPNSDNLTKNTLSKSKEIKIIGTLDKSETDFIANMLDEYFKVAYSIDSGKINSFNKSLQMNSFLYENMKALENKEIKLEIIDSNGTSFCSNGNYFSEFYIKYVNKNLEIKTDEEYEKLDDNLMLIPSEYIENDSNIQLKVTIGSSFSINEYTLNGYKFEDLIALFENFKESFYFTNDSDIGKLINIKSGKLYRGNDSVPFVSSTFSFTEIKENNTYLISSTIYQNLKNAKTNSERQQILSEIKNVSVNYNDKFIFDETLNTIKIKESLDIDSNKNLILIQDFYSGEELYLSYNDIIIPTNGIGGTDYTKYINSEFQAYFADNGKLIDSTADTSSTVGTAYKFICKYPEIKIRLEIPNTSISSYCNVVHTVNSNEEYYQINIDVDNIPSKNTEVGVKIVVFYIKQVDGENVEEIITTLNYSFIIPGIYKLGNDFNDDKLYNAIINYKVNEKIVYESFKNYLLVDGANAVNELFEVNDINESLDITGINLLTKTKKFSFSNVDIVSLQPFELCGEAQIESLSFIKSNITNDKIKNYISNFKTLEEINLSDNDITSLFYNEKGIFYRALKSLDISFQNNLTNIDGISYLNELSSIDISNNKIGDMRPLINLASLKNVYLYNNNFDNYTGLDSDNTYYGTQGELNIPVYVELIGKGVSVYKTQNEILEVGTSGGDISLNQNINSLIINMIGVFDRIEKKDDFITDLNFPQSVKISNTENDINAQLSIEYLLINGVVKTNNEVVASSNGVKVDIIVSVNYNNTKVYRLFTVTYYKVG